MTTRLADPINPVTREFLQDPYPFYRQLREQEPVFWSETGGYWIVTSYKTCHDTLGDLRFGKKLEEWNKTGLLRRGLLQMASMMNLRADTMLNRNPPDHTRLRLLVNKAFTPAMVEGMRPRIERISATLLDAIGTSGEFDLIADYAFPLPVTVIAELLGVPAQDQARFKVWSNAISRMLEPNMKDLRTLLRVVRAAREFADYLKPLFEERRRNPGCDLLSALVIAEEEGDKLSETELIANTMLLLAAGHETTVNLIGNSLVALLEHPDQMMILLEEPQLLPSAIEEFLRFDSPVQMTRRLAQEDAALGGKTVRKGDLVNLFIGAANRDPAQFVEPDRLDVTRTGVKHLAFGHGIHHCLGAFLARVEAEIAICALLKRFPSLRLRIDRDKLVYREPFMLRGVVELPVSTTG